MAVANVQPGDVVLFASSERPGASMPALVVASRQGQVCFSLTKGSPHGRSMVMDAPSLAWLLGTRAVQIVRREQVDPVAWPMCFN